MLLPRQSSFVKIASPGLRDTKGKGKNFFRRLSGSRNDKVSIADSSYNFGRLVRMDIIRVTGS